MGYGSAGPRFFDPIAWALIDAGASDEQLRQTLGNLIDGLQELDWDTEHDSLQKFQDYPAIVEVFADRGIILPEQPTPNDETTKPEDPIHAQPISDEMAELSSRLITAANRVTSLRATLVEVLREFSAEEHPRFESCRSGWVPRSRLDRWKRLAEE